MRTDEGITTEINKVGLTIQDVKPRHISSCFMLIVLVVGTLLSFLIVILNVLIDIPLFIQGINFINMYQIQQPWPALHAIENLFSLLCHPIGVGVVLGLSYVVTKRKLLMIVQISYFLLATYIIAILKQAFQQSRPIWYDSRIQNWEWFCPKDFGNPSGHSFAAIMLYEPFFSDVLGYGRFHLWSIALVLIVIMVPISRMYLGVHSANQILFGLSTGWTFLILYKYIYQKALYSFAWSLLTSTKKKLKIFLLLTSHILIFIIPIIFYQITISQRPMLPKDINNLNIQCNVNLTGLEVQGSMLTACSIGSTSFGLIYGFLFLKNRTVYRRYLLGNWEYASKIKILAKIGVYVLCAGVPFVVFFVIGQFGLKAYPVGRYVFLSLAVTAAGIGLSFLTPIATDKFNIMKFEDQEEKKAQNIGN